MTPSQIKQARQSLGLTQAKLASTISIKLDKLKSWESGRYGISDEAATAIQWLLDGELPDIESIKQQKNRSEK